jgi:phage tail-like protein
MAEAPQGGQGSGQTGVWVDPYRGYNFKLAIQGVNEAHFTEMTGIGAKVEALNFRGGGDSQITHRLPGQVQYADITLRYGLTSSRELWEWFKKGLQGITDRRNVSILLLDQDGRTEVARWNLINAWPSEWRGAPLDAGGREIAIESVTLVFDTLDRG